MYVRSPLGEAIFNCSLVYSCDQLFLLSVCDNSQSVNFFCDSVYVRIYVHITFINLCVILPSVLQRQKLANDTHGFVPGRQFYCYVQNYPEVQEELQDYYFEDFNIEERLNPTQ